MERLIIFLDGKPESAHEWRRVEQTDHEVYVSSNGDIVSFGRRSGMFLALSRNGSGYVCIALTLNGKQSTHRLHRIVAKLFIQNPEGKPEINHKNGIRHDNRVENLEWCTRSENTNHAIQTGLSKPYVRRESRAISQYTRDGKLVKTWHSLVEAKAALGVSKEEGNIGEVLRNKAKIAYGFSWKYA